MDTGLTATRLLRRLAWLFALAGAACSDTTVRSGCRSDNECAAARWCRLSDGRCIDGCRDDAACPAGQVCDEAKHACTPGCTAEHACAEPRVCRTSDGTCVACLEDPDCAGDHDVCWTDNTCVGGCSDAKPCTDPLVCDPEDKVCVRCLGDHGCPSYQICDPATRSCIQGCSATKPCPEPLVCDIQARSCVLCIADDDCPGGQVCQSATHTCVAGCNAAHACAQPLVCRIADGTCVGCVQDADCAGAHEICTSSNTCAAGCSSAKPCEGPQICDPGTRTCVECVADDHCPAGKVCNPASHACVAGCTAAHACPSLQVCRTSDGACVACVQDGDCAGAHEVCTSANTCVGGCSTAKPCEAPEVCNLAARTCVECVADDQCAAGKVCSLASHTCVAGCTAAHACAQPQVCRTADGTCVACVQDADCAGAHDVCSSGNACVSGCSTVKPCTAPQVCNTAARTCVECLTDDQCLAGTICNTTTHACAPGCTTAHPCPAGNNCVSGQCVGAPAITDFNPKRGFAGTADVTLTGVSFSATRGTVKFASGVTATTVPTWTNSSIVARVPPNAQTGPIHLDTVNGAADSPTPFTVLTGCSGSSLQTGSGAYLQIADPGASTSLAGGNRLTLEAWVFPSASTAAQQNILYKESQYVLAIVNGKLQANLYTSAGWLGLTGAGAVPANQWSHVAAVYDGWTLRTYVNGVLGTETPVSGLVGHSGYNFYAGANAGSNPFTGFIDEVRISGKVRYTGSSFVTPSAKWVADSATQLLLHLDEGSGTDVYDDSGNPNSGALQGSAAFSTLTLPLACVSVFVGMSPDVGGAGTAVTLSGKGFGAARAGAAVTFNGAPVQSSDYVSWSDGEIVVKAPPGGSSGRVAIALQDETLTSGSDFKYQACDARGLQLPYNATGGATAWLAASESSSLGGGLTLTLEAWFYPTLSNSTEQALVRKESQYEIAYMSGKLQGRIYTAVGWSAFAVGPNVSTGSWHHVAMSYDGAALRLFVDGQMGTPVAISGIVNKSGYALYIGANVGSVPAYGQVDEVRISSTVRYKQSFTPPRGPFAADDFTSALWHLDEGPGETQFADATNNNNTATAASAAASNTFAALGCGPAITDVAPRSAPVGGGNVTIKGRGFGSAAGSVKQAGADLTIVSWSDTTVVVAIPADATGALTLTTAAGEATSTGFPVNALRCGGGSLQLPFTTNGGATSYVEVGDSGASTSLAGGTKLTVEAWIYPTLSVGGTQYIVYKESQYTLALINNVLQARIYTSVGWSVYLGLGAVTLNAWNHVAAVYDGQQLRTYVNGTLTNHPSTGAPDYISGIVSHSGYSFYVGSNTASNPFFGRIDEVRVSGTVRYTAGFAPPLGAFASDAATQLLFHFDDGELSGTAADASSNNNTGTLNSAARFTDDAPAFACGPVVSDLAPRVGGSGTAVTILGRAFGATRGSSAVKFNDVAAQAADYVSWADGKIVVKAPAAGSTGRVKVTVGAQTADSGIDFIYAPCALDALQLPYNGTGGATGYAQANDSGASTSLGGGSFVTLEAWFYPTLINTTDQWLVYKESQYTLGVNNGKLKARIYTSVGWSVFAVGDTALTAGEWHHVGFVYDGTAIRIFQDGTFAASPLAISGRVSHSGYNFYVGSNTGSNPAYGLIDELRVSSLPRYQGDFTPPRGPFTADAYTSGLWHFNEGVGERAAADASGNNNTLSLSSAVDLYPAAALTCGPTVNDVAQPRAVPLGGGRISIKGRGFGTTPGTVIQNGVTLNVVSWSDTEIVVDVPAGGTGQLLVTTAAGTTTSTGVPVNALPCEGWALQLPTTATGGATAYLQVADPGAATSLAGGTRLTLEAWIYPTQNVVGTQLILHKESQYALALTNNKLQARIYTSVGWSSYVGQGPVTLNAWNHVAAVYDGHELRTYVNGQLVNNPTTGAVDHISGIVGHSGYNFYVGSNTGSNPFYGYIDEVLVSGSVRYTGTAFDPPVRHRPIAADHILLHLDDGPLVTSAADATGNNNTATYNGAADAVYHSGGTVTCPPILEDVQPRAGAASTAVTVSGTSFGASRGASTMDFNGTEAAAYTSWGDTQAVLAAPSGGSTGPVSLSKDGAPPLRSSPLDFRYAPCALFALQLPYNATGGATGWFKVDDPGAATSLGGGNTLTVEAWVRPTLLPAGDMFVVYKESQYAMTVQNGIFKARVYNSAGWTAWQGAAPVTIDAWSHVAFSYDGTSLRTFVNGSLSTTTAVTCCVGHSGYTFYVGSNTGSGPFYGEIDEVRASKAVRYNASFTRPAAWFTNDSNTSGLWHFNDGESSTTAADSSGNNNTLSNGAGSAAQIWPSRAPFACP